MQQRPRRTVLLVGRHRPHEIGLLVVSAVTGVTLLLHQPPPEVTRVLPGWHTPAWAWIVLASAVVGLAGCLWRGRASTGLVLEGAGMLISTAAITLYVVAALLVPDRDTAAAVISSAAWGAMNLWRAVQVHLDLRELR